MKVCMLTSTHKPFDVRVFHKESRSLAKFHEVVIVTPDKKTWEKIVDNVKIITVERPKSKLLHFITLWRIFKVGLKQDCDVYHCHEPDSFMVGIIIKMLKKNVKIIYDVHEHYPSLFSENTLFPNFSRKYIKIFATLIEKIIAKFADTIIVVDKVLYKLYTLYSGGKNVHVISNYPILQLFSDTSVPENGGNVIVYVGGISRHKGAYELLRAVKLISKRFKDIRLIFVGEFANDEDRTLILETFKDVIDSGNTQVTGWVNHSEIVKYLKKAKVCLSILQPLPRYVVATPTKLLEYMSCSKPIVASNFPPVREIVGFVRSGILVDPNDVEEIVNSILYLLENPAEAKKMGIRGRRFVEREMSWEKMEKRLLEIYGKI